ncbi:carboxyltransferase domain-containing protein [Klebsiella pneumoniae]|nr:carboxyltransferase domain-containing protein [Klebsiella pneumoniae]
MVELHIFGGVHGVVFWVSSRGFPYFGGLPEQLAMPRRAEPRVLGTGGDPSVSADRKPVFIRWRRRAAGRLLGRTPLALFDPKREESRCCCVPAIACAFVPQKEGVC